MFKVYTLTKLQYFNLKDNIYQNGGKIKNYNNILNPISFANKQQPNIVFLSGIPSSGKSTLSNKFGKNGYIIISLDELIENKLIPKFKNEIKTEFNGKKTALYGVYHNNKYGETISKARTELVKNVKDIIKKDTKKKYLIEGCILHEGMLRDMLGKNHEFTFIYIIPKNKKTYNNRFIKRFLEDPDNYGRLGRLRKLDLEHKSIGIKDFKKNGISGKIISNMIKKVSNMKYKYINEWLKLYDDIGLNINIYKN